MLFETQEDLDNEREAIFRFSAFTNCIPYKLPMESEADYVLMRGNDAKAIVEIKCRKIPSTRYDEYLIGQKKYNALIRWAELGFVPILLIRWTDVIGYVKLPVQHRTSMQGKNDRGQTILPDPVFLIPMSKFKMLDD